MLNAPPGVCSNREIEQVRMGGLPPLVDVRGQAPVPDLFFLLGLIATLPCYNEPPDGERRGGDNNTWLMKA